MAPGRDQRPDCGNAPNIRRVSITLSNNAFPAQRGYLATPERRTTMFDKNALRSMDRAEIVGRVAEIDVRVETIRGKERTSKADETELNELLYEREQLDNHRRRLDLKSRFAGARGDTAEDGRVKFLPGDGNIAPEGATSRAEHGGDQLGGLRSRAMRRLDSNVRSNTMAADAAGTFERLLGTGSLAERSWIAQYVDAAGSPEYLSAFSKKLCDPEGARDRFSAAEVEAVRRVHEVAEARAMTLTDTQGGYLIPAQLEPAILLSSNGFINPIREMARVVQATGDVWHGVSSEGSSARWAAEASEAEDNSFTLAQPTVPVHKGDCFVPTSIEAMDDGANFVTEVSRIMVEAIDNLWATAYVTGSGIGQPRGFVTALAAAGAPVVVAGNGSEALADDDPVKLQNLLPARAQANSSWAMALPTINKLRFAETSNGSLLYPSLQNDVPTLLGRRVFEISTMDSTINASATENNYLIALGDWSRFLIVDRVGTQVEIVPHLFGPTRRPSGQRGFYAYFRTGSDVLTPSQFRLLNVPTTA